MRKIIILSTLLVFSVLTESRVKELELNSFQSVTATYYHAVKSQCSGNHLITADGSVINKTKLKSGELRWVAVSRDLIRIYPYGSKIYVSSNYKDLNGVWEVHDTMNKRHKSRIDFLFHEEVRPLNKPEKILIRRYDR